MPELKPRMRKPRPPTHSAETDLLDVRQALSSLEQARYLFEKMTLTSKSWETRTERVELYRDAMAQVSLSLRFLQEIEDRDNE